MIDRFTRTARAAVTRAEEEARLSGSRTIEAEHLLLATSGAVGLDRTAVEAALAAEWRASLDTVGVDRAIPPPVRYAGRMRFGASAKLALERAVTRADGRIGMRDVALGVLSAELGTVPRALKRADVDTSHLWRSA